MDRGGAPLVSSGSGAARQRLEEDCFLNQVSNCRSDSNSCSKVFPKISQSTSEWEEGDVSMEGRGGISSLTSASAAAGGQSSKRRRQQTGTKRKAIHSVVSSAQREGKKITVEQEQAGVPNPVAPLPAVSPVLAHFVLPEAADPVTSSNKSSLGSSSATSQGTISGPALEDSMYVSLFFHYECLSSLLTK